MESLWSESWMTLRPLPRPDPMATPGDLDYLDAVVEQRSKPCWRSSAAVRCSAVAEQPASPSLLPGK